MIGYVGEGQVHGGNPAHRVLGVRHRVLGGIGLGPHPVAGVIRRRGGEGDPGVGEGFYGDVASGIVGVRRRAAGVGSGTEPAHAKGAARAAVVDKKSIDSDPIDS